ncbi:MAG TPA: hypothetical protein VEZ17_10395 [Chitinophagaceae bacterium]|nr:hypothetical protein [Chitinophagaceae bacterium]
MPTTIPPKNETGQGWKKPDYPANPKIPQILIQTNAHDLYRLKQQWAEWTNYPVNPKILQILVRT